MIYQLSTPQVLYNKLQGTPACPNITILPLQDLFLDHWGHIQSHRMYPGHFIPWSCKSGPGELVGEALDRLLDLASHP